MSEPLRGCYVGFYNLQGDCVSLQLAGCHKGSHPAMGVRQRDICMFAACEAGTRRGHYSGYSLHILACGHRNGAPPIAEGHKGPHPAVDMR